MATPLKTANLAEIGARAAIPAYDRGRLTAGILHFGIGNFHRAHQPPISTTSSRPAGTSISRSSAPA